MGKQVFYKTLIYFIILAGIVISLYQFFYGRSLWNDEATLSYNIIQKSPAQLLQPLHLAQVAPILFLQIEHFFFFYIASSDYGLRLFPLFCYLTSIYFFYAGLKNSVRNPLTIVFAMSVYVFCSTLIYYSSEVKQYMGDVLLTSVFYYTYLKPFKNNSNRVIALGFLGVVSIFFSNIACILLLTLGLCLVFDAYRKRVFPVILAMVYLVWAIVFFIYYVNFIKNHPTRDYMLQYWTKEKGFMPMNPLKLDFYSFLIQKFQMIFYFLFGYGQLGKLLLPILLITGVIKSYISKKIDLIILILCPIITHFILSGLKLYPFEKRLILYLFPIITFGCALGFDFMIDLIKIRLSKQLLRKLTLTTLFIPLIFFSFSYGNGLPITKREYEQVIENIKPRIVSGDKIYIYGELIPTYWFYRDVKKYSFHNLVIEGSYPDRKKYIDELKKIKGRCWVILSDEGTEGGKYIVNTLDSLKLKKLYFFEAPGASAYLYDFGK